MKVELQNETIEPLKAALEEYCKNHDLHQCKCCAFSVAMDHVYRRTSTLQFGALDGTE